MPFKTPKPVYDKKLVADIEVALNLEYWTEIIYRDKERDGLVTTLARGIENKSYPRPMFQVLDDRNEGLRTHPYQPCPCYEFHRTNQCTEHPELEWDDLSHGWIIPGTDGRDIEDLRSDLEIERDSIISNLATAIRGSQPMPESLSQHFYSLGLTQPSRLIRMSGTRLYGAVIENTIQVEADDE